MSDEIELRKNTDEHRYEALIDGKIVGHMTYRVGEQVVHLPHTEIDPDQGGKGIGKKLAQFGLEDIKAGGVSRRRVAADCPFVAAYIDAHEEFHPLLASDESEPIA